MPPPLDALRATLTSTLADLANEHGFDDVSDVAIWRSSAEKVDVVQIEFLNRATAEAKGLPMTSFLLRGGCHFFAVPNFGNWTPLRKPRPGAEDCAVNLDAVQPSTRTLLRLGAKSFKYGDIPNVWSINESDSALTLTSDFYKKCQLLASTMEESFRTLGDLYNFILSSDEDFGSADVVIHGYGVGPSPKFQHIAGFAAYGLENWEAAAMHFRSLIDLTRAVRLRRATPDYVRAIEHLIVDCDRRQLAHRS